MRARVLSVAIVAGLITACADANKTPTDPANAAASVDGRRVPTQRAPLAASMPATNECNSQQAGWIFCDDFESNNLNKYFEYDDHGGKFARKGGAGVSGSYGMEGTFQPGETSAGYLHLAFGKTPSSYLRPADAGTSTYREIYWRFYVERAPGWSGNGAGSMTRAMAIAKSDWSQAMLMQGTTSPSDDRYLMLDGSSGTTSSGSTITTNGYNDVNNMRSVGSAQSASPVSDPSQVGSWQCLEFHVKLNDPGAANGLMEMRVNGALAATKSGLNWVASFASYGINSIFIEQHDQNGAPAANTRRFDNFVVSTQPIGCGTSSGGSRTLTAMAMSPATATISTGGSQQFTVSGTYSDGSTGSPSVTYAATGGTISSSGLYSAGSTPGTYRVIASQTDGALKDTSVVTVASTAPTVTKMTMTPATVSLAPSAKQQFTVSAQWSDGSTKAPNVAFTATGGTITSSGLYTAGTTAGTYKVIASQTDGSLKDTSIVTVTAPKTITKMTMSPAAVTLAASGTQQFAVTAQWSDGSTTTPAVTYSATGGTITSGGLYTAGSTAGSFRVIAAQQGGTFVDTSAVTITASGGSGGGSGGTEPTPSGTIIWDSRAGGKQDIQAFNSVSDFNNALKATGGDIESTQNATWNIATNYNGANKKALRIDWTATPGSQSSAPTILYYPKPVSHVFTSVVIHLGKTATGGGLGNTGSFVPVTNGGGMKRFMWYRQRDNGNDRVYWVWGAAEQAKFGNALQIDNRNLVDGFSADYGVGQDVRWTFELIAGTQSTVRVWRNGVQVYNNTNAGIGSLPFAQSEFPTTRFNTTQSESEYWTDLVIWSTP